MGKHPESDVGKRDEGDVGKRPEGDVGKRDVLMHHVNALSPTLANSTAFMHQADGE